MGVLAVVAVLALVFVPVESRAFSTSLVTANTCQAGQVGSNCGGAAEYTVGRAGYATLTGTWGTLYSGNGGVLNQVDLTINNGPSSVACSLCQDQLYQVVGGAGSFDVSGFGPFHISVVYAGTAGSSASTNIFGTVDSAVA